MGDLNLNTQGGDYAGGNIDKRSGTFTNVAIHEAPTPLALNLHQIPPPPRDFTGRAAELTELLANFEKGVAISGLHGQGGIGKTALALKLAEQLMPRYPDAQFYLDLKGVSEKPLAPVEALAHVIRAYHPTSKLPEDEAQLRGLYQTVLHYQRALILMDNAKDAAQVESLLPPATCCLLVTSRQHFHLPGLHTKNLDTLPSADAHELLIKIAPRIAPTPTLPRSLSARTGEGVLLPSPVGELADGGRAGDGGADEIAKLCGYLPLALRLTASALAERVDLSPADLIRKLTDTQQRLKLTGAEASLQLSYDLLTPELQKLWRALAVFPETFDRAAAAAVWELEEDKAHEALGKLVKFSLLDFDPHPAPPPVGGRESLEHEYPSPGGRGDRGEGEHQGRYRLHDLARLYADSRLSEDERYEAQKHHATYYETVIRAADKLYLQGNAAIMLGLKLFDLEWTNIQAGHTWAEKHASKDNYALKLCDDYPAWGYTVLGLRQHPRECIHWQKLAASAARQLKNRVAEGAHLGNLGIAYKELGELSKAIEFLEQQLIITRETGDRQGEANALMNMGIAYRSLDEPQRAIDFYKQALIAFHEIGDRRGEANTLLHTGNSYRSLGKPQRAIDFHEQALIAFHEIGGERGKGITLGNLGSDYRSLGEPRKAIAFHEQSLVIAHEIGDRRSEGHGLFNMSLALDKLGERVQAIANAEAALKIYEEIESPYAERARKQLEAWRLNH